MEDSYKIVHDVRDFEPTALKLLFNETLGKAENIKELDIYQTDNNNPIFPGIIAPSFPKLMLRISRYNLLSKLELGGIHWFRSSFAMFCKTLPHLENLDRLKLDQCWFPSKAFYYLPEGLTLRKEPIRQLLTSLYDDSVSDKSCMETELWIACKLISRRLVAETFRIFLFKNAVILSEKHMLTAGETMPSLSSPLSTEKVELRVRLGIDFSHCRRPKLSAYNKEMILTDF